MAYDLIEPFGAIRGDMQAAKICEVVANVNRDWKTAPFEMTDFILRVPQKGDKTARESFAELQEARNKGYLAFQVELAREMAAKEAREKEAKQNG